MTYFSLYLYGFSVDMRERLACGLKNSLSLWLWITFILLSLVRYCDISTQTQL